MKKSLRIGSLDMFFRVRRIARTEGMCSNTIHGLHIPMWDFDDVLITDVVDGLMHIQDKYQLPRIYILETKPGSNYVAYCFEEITFKDALAIVLETPLVCWNFWRLSVVRGYFTLRIGKKHNSIPRHYATLPGKSPEKIGVGDLVHAIIYEIGK